MMALIECANAQFPKDLHFAFGTCTVSGCLILKNSYAKNQIKQLHVVARSVPGVL